MIVDHITSWNLEKSRYPQTQPMQGKMPRAHSKCRMMDLMLNLMAFLCTKPLLTSVLSWANGGRFTAEKVVIKSKA